MRGHDALETGTAGVEVAHGGPFDTGSPCVGRAHRHRQIHRLSGLRRIEAHQSRRGGGSADGTPRPVGVDLGLDGGRRADARDHLVAHDDACQHLAAAAPQFLAHGDGAGRDVDGRVPAAQAVALVHLQRHAGGGVHHGGPDRLHPVAMTQDSRLAGSAHGRGKSGEVGVFRQAAAGQHRADGVQCHVFRGGNSGGVKVRPTRFRDKHGKVVQIVLLHDPLGDVIASAARQSRRRSQPSSRHRRQHNETATSLSRLAMTDSARPTW